MTRRTRTPVVIERMQTWIGRRVRVRTTIDVAAPVETLLGVVPVGRDVMLELRDDVGRERLLSASVVMELASEAVS